MTITANPDIWAPFLASVDALTRGERRRLLAFLENVVSAASSEIPKMATSEFPKSTAAPTDNRYQIDALDVDPADWLPVVCSHCGESRAICLEMAGAAWVFQCVACGEVFTLKGRLK